MHCWFHTDLNYPSSSATPFALAASEISSTQDWFLDTMHPYISHLISIDGNNQNLIIGNNKFLLEEANNSQLNPPDKEEKEGKTHQRYRRENKRNSLAKRRFSFSVPKSTGFHRWEYETGEDSCVRIPGRRRGCLATGFKQRVDLTAE
ncbi:hypothetical protein KFK09_027362 [Dendrobium nobile]|uniref:Uncharacterized protein n=1 Tax=Dendrobium nobile TaxID=94219 RepID=A0A8T3A951_DENNO|nr:hypothetical protein KFK09_027362 [Dendrobium nobile]